MGNTIAKPGPFDALTDADPNEPFFPLMGRDPLAPPLVMDWAERTRASIRDLEDEKERRRLQAKCNEAEEIAWSMREYCRSGSAVERRAADTRASYNDAAPREDHRWKALIIAGTRQLRGSAAAFAEALEHLPADQAVALREVVEKLNRIATAYEPKRASFGDQPELPLSMAEAGAE